MLAAYHGHADTVRALLAAGADPNRRNGRDQSVVAGALFKGEREIVRLLADNLTDITNGASGLQGVLFPELGRSDKHPDGVFSVGNNSPTTNYGVWWYWLGLVLVIIVLLIIGA